VFLENTSSRVYVSIILESCDFITSISDCMDLSNNSLMDNILFMKLQCNNSLLHSHIAPAFIAPHKKSIGTLVIALTLAILFLS
jgi:hypothetical protein